MWQESPSRERRETYLQLAIVGMREAWEVRKLQLLVRDPLTTRICSLLLTWRRRRMHLSARPLQRRPDQLRPDEAKPATEMQCERSNAHVELRPMRGEQPPLLDPVLQSG